MPFSWCNFNCNINMSGWTILWWKIAQNNIRHTTHDNAMNEWMNAGGTLLYNNIRNLFDFFVRLCDRKWKKGRITVYYYCFGGAFYFKRKWPLTTIMTWMLMAFTTINTPSKCMSKSCLRSCKHNIKLKAC